MLYVFLVESGTPLMFDMTLAMESVASLQRAIAQVCAIEVHEQVLLISGGTALKPECVVSKYSAGTDTNPIFLFARNHKDCGYASFAEDKVNSYANMEERVRGCEGMAVNHQSLVVKFQLAQNLAEISDEELKTCTLLVDSQHLQQQGWAALVANLEDHTKNLKKLFDRFLVETERYFQARPSYERLLNKFSDIIAQLDVMPLLPIFHPEGADKNTRHTLLTKYASGPNQVLVKLAIKYKDWIDQLSEEKLLAMKHEVNKLLNSTADSPMKEVVGIEDRLFKLNELLAEAQTIQMDQRKHRENLYSNHNRLLNNSDQGDLKGLNQIHQVHLQLMLENHKRLMEKCQMCKNAKTEMCNTLCTRIAWVATIQSGIYKYENLFVLYLQQLNRLNFHLQLIEQMELAPEAYLKTLAEIRRRKIFSTNFLKWASGLSQQSSELHHKEVKTREEFTATNPCPLFLHDLFPGMSDLPPPFAVKCPEAFDVSLPNVTQEDLDSLKKLLPGFSPLLEVPPPDVMPHVSHKSVVSDSAFSSEVPSSQGMAGPSHSSTSLQSGHLFRTETLSSLGAGECAGAAPEVFSPTSSPFEDPFLPSSDTDVNSKSGKSGKTKKIDDSGLECKKMHLTEAVAEKEMFSPIAEEQNNVESDGDEFERVESVPKLYDPFLSSTANATAKQVSIRAGSKSNTDGLRVQIDELQLTPSEGLRSPESNVTSHDFHSADYFFDDSMPSSITESTGLSALGKSQHMVKSHHVIVAELQHQLCEKNEALLGTKGSLRMSRSADILKMHATMSALQKFIQDLLDTMRSNFSNLREAVVMQRLTVDEETSTIMKAVKMMFDTMRYQADQDKAVAVTKVLKEEHETHVELLNKTRLQLEVEAQKLCDAHQEIELYQGHVYNLNVTIEEMRQDFECQLQKVKAEHKLEIEELKQSMTMVHELELESLREDQNQKIQEKNDEIMRIMEEFSSKQAELQGLIIQNEVDFQDQLAKEREQWSMAQVIPQKEVGIQSYDMQWQSENQAVEEMDVQETPHRMGEGNLKAAGLEEPDYLMIALRNRHLLSPLSAELHKIWDILVVDLGSTSSLEDFHQLFVQRIKECVDEIMSEKLREQSEPVNTSDAASEDHNVILMNILKDIRKNINTNLGASHSHHAAGKAAPHVHGSSQLFEKLTQAIEMFGNIDEIFKCNIKLIESFATEKETVEKEKQSLQRKLEEDHMKYREEMERLKSLHIAENQVSFNEAINKLTREKDEVISTLMNDIAILEKKQEVVKSVIGNYLDPSCLDAVEQDDARSLEQSQIIIRTLSELKEKIELPGAHMLSSSAVDLPSSSLVSKVKALEKELQKEKGKVQKIFEKVSKASHLKLSLVTCDPGDIVLFFYDEKHKNYIAFHFGNTLHFLHSDGLEILELKIPPDSPTSSWAIGVVVDKDYCLAKKKPNRYNVQHGSVFYRVRVKSWEQYREMRSMMQLVLGTGELFVFRQSPVEATEVASNSSQMSASTI